MGGLSGVVDLSSSSRWPAQAARLNGAAGREIFCLATISMSRMMVHHYYYDYDAPGTNTLIPKSQRTSSVLLDFAKTP